MGKRKRKYYDVNLTEAEIKRIRKGNTVHRIIDGVGIAVKGEDKKLNRKISKLEKQLRKLKRELKRGGDTNGK